MEEIRAGHVETLAIQANRIRQRTGFSLDIGGSLAKLVYATEEGPMIRLHFVSYPRKDAATLISLLKEKVARNLPKDVRVYTCGVGLHDWTKLLNEELDLKIQNVMEMECFVDAFRYLTRTMPHAELVFPPMESVKASTTRLLVQLHQMMAVINKEGTQSQGTGTLKDQPSQDHMPALQDPPAKLQTSVTHEEPMPVSDKVQYPILLCILGSAASYVKVNSDGTHVLVDGTSFCGKTFMGLAKHLVQAESFDEILDLAAKGNHENVHVYGRHLKTGTNSDIYSGMADEMRLFEFAQESDFSREDMAAALLNSVSNVVAQTCQLTALAYDIRTIYLSGGFAGFSELVRQSLATGLDLRCTTNPKGIKIDYFFLRFGGYYGALGSLLRTIGADLSSANDDN